MEHFDVVVVGAGLAGLQCARLLGERGFRVLLVDRKPFLDQWICGSRHNRQSQPNDNDQRERRRRHKRCLWETTLFQRLIDSRIANRFS
jgi:glycine/D-amino acid oxidase-like deaminating enzyme